MSHALPVARPSARVRRPRVLSLALSAALAAAAFTAWSSNASASTDLFVSPTGSNSNAGTDIAHPFQTIQKALDVAVPGTTIHLAVGAYHEPPVTKVDGTAAAPISIVGPETGKDQAGRYRAVLYGTGRIVNINNSYYTLRGFTIDGQEALAKAAWPTTLAGARPFKDSVAATVKDGRLIYVGSLDTTVGLTGITIDDMFLRGAGGECVRMRNAAHDNVVENSVIEYCGLFGKGNDTTQYRFHNGEGVYIGTSPSSTTQPMYKNDTSHGNIVRNNTIATYGSECFDVKENAYGNVFEGNDCRYNDEPGSFLGSNLELRGHDNVVVDNSFTGSHGYGVKIASDSGFVPGGNVVRANAFAAQATAPILHKSTAAQGVSCGNTADVSALVSGTAIPGIGAPCAPSPTPTPDPTTPSPTPSTTSPAPRPTPTSPAPVPTTPAPTPTTSTSPSPLPVPGLGQTLVSLEAESGTLTSPFVTVATSSSSGGRYVVQTASSGTGSATYTVFVPIGGSYRVDGLARTPDGSSNSFYVWFDSGSRKAWALAEPLTTWTWDQGVTFTLSAGTHVLHLQKRETHTAIDVLKVVRVA